MADDPIVAETRRLREEMMEEVGNSLDGLFEFLRNEQEKYRDRLVRLPPRKATPVSSATAPDRPANSR